MQPVFLTVLHYERGGRGRRCSCGEIQHNEEEKEEMEGGLTHTEQRGWKKDRKRKEGVVVELIYGNGLIRKRKKKWEITS